MDAASVASCSLVPHMKVLHFKLKHHVLKTFSPAWHVTSDVTNTLLAVHY